MKELEDELEKTRMMCNSSVVLSCTSIGMSILNIIGNWSPIAVVLVMISVAVLEIACFAWTRYLLKE